MPMCGFCIQPALRSRAPESERTYRWLKGRTVYQFCLSNWLWRTIMHAIPITLRYLVFALLYPSSLPSLLRRQRILETLSALFYLHTGGPD